MPAFRAVVLSAPTVRAVYAAALAVLFVFVMAAGVVAGTVSVLIGQGVHGVCPTEDSSSCVWVAPLQGNHQGQPVIVVNGPAR